jgi:hypothetical protein
VGRLTFLLGGLLEGARDDGLDDVLADVGGEARLDEAHGRLAGAEAGEANFFLNVGGDALGFFLNVRERDGDVEGVFASFN